MTDLDTAPAFVAWPKTPRLFRDVTITEKIDGTNAAVGITPDGAVYAQSRKRIITPGDDNFGFAAWVAANAGTLVDDLGPGLHFGEWWGAGIQRGYGQTDPDERTFSLFNVHKWRRAEFYTPNLDTVPRLYVGPFDTEAVTSCLLELAQLGSFAEPGYTRPEGVIVYHSASGQTFKALIENDQAAKSDLPAAA